MSDQILKMLEQRAAAGAMKNSRWLWPNAKRIAVVFNVCLEAWSDGKAPGISPMGNPLAPGVLDTMAISWAAYGVKTGIYRLLDAFDRHGAKTSVMVNAVVARARAGGGQGDRRRGHEVLSHSYAMDVVPALLSDEDERKNIERCTRLLEQASGRKIEGWLPARHLEADHAEASRRGRVPLVRRRVRCRSALCAELRRKKDRRDPALL